MAEATQIAVTVILLVLGLAGLGTAGFLVTTHDVSTWGQASQWMQISEDSPTDTVPDNASVIAYDDLPPEGQRAFDAAREGQVSELWEEDDRQLLDTLKEYEYIRYEGEYYEYGFAIGEPESLWGIVMLTSGLGLMFTAAGVWRMRENLLH